MNFIAWTEIESFHNIRKFTKSHPEILNSNAVVEYKAKVKLHGTNAGIQIHTDGTVVAQSRTALLTEDADNVGFTKWVNSNKALWAQIADDTDDSMIIFGEWIGKGIQKGVACSEIPEKSFVVFAARLLDETNRFIVEPYLLQSLVKNIPNTYVLPWHDHKTYVDWSAAAESLTLKVEEINRWVNEVEQNDPWIENTFGVKGTGEGLVFYPVSNEHLGYENFANLVFKAKGEKHKNIKTAAPAQVDASSAASVQEFVDLVLTEARLEQGAGMVLIRNGSDMYDMKQLGPFLKWISGDVQKETQDEMEASNLTWKKVSKEIGDRARAWYISRAQAL